MSDTSHHLSICHIFLPFSVYRTGEQECCSIGSLRMAGRSRSLLVLALNADFPCAKSGLIHEVTGGLAIFCPVIPLFSIYFGSIVEVELFGIRTGKLHLYRLDLLLSAGIAACFLRILPVRPSLIFYISAILKFTVTHIIELIHTDCADLTVHNIFFPVCGRLSPSGLSSIYRIADLFIAYFHTGHFIRVGTGGIISYYLDITVIYKHYIFPDKYAVLLLFACSDEFSVYIKINRFAIGICLNVLRCLISLSKPLAGQIYEFILFVPVRFVEIERVLLRLVVITYQPFCISSDKPAFISIA